MPVAVTAPVAREIPRRDLRFPLDPGALRTWHREGLPVAHFFNALSIFFPEGETFFIETVRRFADRASSPELAAQVHGFVGQESIHGREHRRYNRALAEAGLPVDELEAGVVAVLDRVRRMTSAEQQLAVTIALEHYTAILARVALEEERVFGGGDPRFTALWYWHAIEETEHKAVAFDLYREVCGEDAVAYLRRVVVMLVATGIFWPLVALYHVRLLHADGVALDPASWWRAGRFLWASPGLLRKIVPPWLEYFRFDFHPWQRNDLGVVRAWRAVYESARRAPA